MQERHWTSRRLEQALDAVRQARRSDGSWDLARIPDRELDVLVLAYQDRGRRFGPARRALVEQATDLLVRVAGPLAVDALRSRLRASKAGGWHLDRADDIAQDAIAWVLGLAQAYRITGSGSFACFVRSHKSLAELARDVAGAYADGDRYDRPSQQVRAALGRIRQEYHDQHGVAPADDDLARMTTAHFWEQARAAVRRSRPGISGTRLDQAARSRLVKSGLLRALEDIPSLRIPDQVVLLDEPVGQDGQTRADMLIGPAPRAYSERQVETVYQLALGGNQWARAALAGRFGALGDVEGTGAAGLDPAGTRGSLTLAQMSAATGAGKAQLREVLEHAVSRLGAPHAQWAYLGWDSVKPTRPGSRIGGIPAEMFADA